MKETVIAIFLLISLQSKSQKIDSCFSSGLKVIKIFIHLKDISFRDSIYVDSNYFENGIELFSPQNIKIVGFRVLYNCPGCDIIEFPVCGNKMPEEYRERASKLFKAKYGWLFFFDINIEVNGRLYLAPEFTVFSNKK